MYQESDEEYIESETTSGIRCENKIKGHKIKKHNLLHYPTKPWYDIWIQSRNRDDFRQRARPKVLPVLQFDYSIAGAQQGQPHFDLMIGTDMSTGAVWA